MYREDDSDFQEDALWTCCREDREDHGCKNTKHKTLINTIVNRSITDDWREVQTERSKKRKAEETSSDNEGKRAREDDI